MNKLKQVFLPAIVVAVGVGSAFATSFAKQTQTMVNGYYFDNTIGQCVDKQIKCSPVEGNTCTWKDASNNTHNLRFFNGTSCTFELAKP